MRQFKAWRDEILTALHHPRNEAVLVQKDGITRTQQNFILWLLLTGPGLIKFGQLLSLSGY